MLRVLVPISCIVWSGHTKDHMAVMKNDIFFNEVNIVIIKGVCCFLPPVSVPVVKIIFPKLNEIITGPCVPGTRNISIIFYPIIESIDRKYILVKLSHPLYIGRLPYVHHDLLIMIKGINMISILIANQIIINKKSKIFRRPLECINVKIFVRVETNSDQLFMVPLTLGDIIGLCFVAMHAKIFPVDLVPVLRTG